MKKALILLLALIAVFALAGCGGGSKDEGATPTPGQSGVYTPLQPSDDNLDDSLDDSLPLASSAPQAAETGSLVPDTAVTVTSQPVQDDSMEDDAFLEEIDDDPVDPEDDLPLDLVGDDADADPLASQASASSTPAPTAAPATDIPIKEYKYETYTDDALGFSVNYPSHWVLETAGSTITFTEPVTSGIPMRLALSVKSHEGKLSTEQAKKEFTNYMNTIKSDYTKFAKGKVDTKITFLNRRGWGCQYKAQTENKDVINGYVTMVNVEQSNQIVALHFSAPQKMYNKTSRSMFKTVMYSVTRLVDSGSDT